MQRWVNDYNIAQKIMYGYRPCLPFEIKNVGADTEAMLMEKPDSDYRYAQVEKQIENDKNSPNGGINLNQYKKDIKAEARNILNNISKWQLVKLATRKLFGMSVNDKGDY